MSKMLVKCVESVIPGYNDFENGELISTEEILRNIEKPKDGNSKRFDQTFLKKMLGFDTIAFTNSTADFVRQYWNKESRPSVAEVFSSSQSTPNTSLNLLLGKAVTLAINDLYRKESEVGIKNIIAHIHITGFLRTEIERDLVSLRQQHNIGSKPLQTLIIQQGCSGLLSAIDTAKLILSGSPQGSNILITGDNNMLIHGHQRVNKIADISNINHWLWGSIFGEGVGAIIVGTFNEENTIKGSLLFAIDSVESELVEKNWRVSHQYDSHLKTTEVVVKAREVRATYLTSIKANVTKSIEQCGGLDNIFKICMHESNPKLIVEIANELKIPLEMIPSISGQVGTLACVSSFSLLSLAFKEYDGHLLDHPSKSKIILALIGEAGGVIAGNICFSAKLV